MGYLTLPENAFQTLLRRQTGGDRLGLLDPPIPTVRKLDGSVTRTLGG